MLIPNIFFAIKNIDEKNLCTNRFMNVIEQIGRYACIVLMWLPLLVREFDFPSTAGFIVYLVGNGALIAAYRILFIYYDRKSVKLALALAIIPSCIFLLSGITLRHWLLAAAAVLFAVGHVFVTYDNAKKRASSEKG